MKRNDLIFFGSILAFFIVLFLGILYNNTIEAAEICSLDKVEYSFLYINPQLVGDLEALSEEMTRLNHEEGWDIMSIEGISNRTGMLTLLARRPLNYKPTEEPDA